VLGYARRATAARPVAAQAYETGRNQNLPTVGDDSVCFDMWLGTKSPAIVYLPCLHKAKNNAKASNLESWCRQTDHTFICADYMGTGGSSGDFIDGTVGRWTDDAIRMIENVSPSRKVVLVGAGVGGWVMLLVAKRRPDLVAGLVGLAADPDFTEDLLWEQLDDDVKTSIMEDGVHEITWGDSQYPISRNLIEDGRKNLVLRGEKLNIDCPIRLVHGMADEEVPVETVFKIADLVNTPDVAVNLVKGGTHFLDSELDFKRMRQAVSEVIDNYYEIDLSSPGSG